MFAVSKDLCGYLYFAPLSFPKCCVGGPCNSHTAFARVHGMFSHFSYAHQYQYLLSTCDVFPVLLNCYHLSRYPHLTVYLDVCMLRAIAPFSAYKCIISAQFPITQYLTTSTDETLWVETAVWRRQ